MDFEMIDLEASENPLLLNPWISLHIVNISISGLVDLLKFVLCIRVLLRRPKNTILKLVLLSEIFHCISGFIFLFDIINNL